MRIRLLGHYLHLPLLSLAGGVSGPVGSIYAAASLRFHFDSIARQFEQRPTVLHMLLLAECAW